jgi:two-component system, chemotaxis family, response regulator Rcp1
MRDVFQILLVEDNPADAYLFRKALKSAQVNFELILLEDGADALAYVRQEGRYAASPIPDLAVLDLNLPKHDGAQILEAMRTNPRLSSVPVVIATSSSAPGERTRTEQLGVERYLIKPLDLDSFMKMGLVIKEVLSRKGSLSALSPEKQASNSSKHGNGERIKP